MQERYYKNFDDRRWQRTLLQALMLIAAAFLVGAILSCTSAKRCARLYPVKERTVTTTEIVPGETVYIRDTVTGDCSGVLYEWALRHGMEAEARRTVSKATAQIRVPCPPSEHRVDTAKTTVTVTVENTAKIDALSKDLHRSQAKLGIATKVIIAESLLLLLLLLWRIYGSKAGGLISKIF